MLHIALVGLRRRRARSALTAGGVAIGVSAVVAFLSVAKGLEESARGLINLGGAQMGLFQAGVRDLTASTLPESLADRIESEPGVAEATPVAVVADEVAGDSLLVFGVDPGAFVMRHLVLTAGRRPAGRGALVGDGAADDLGLRVGDTIELDSGVRPCRSRSRRPRRIGAATTIAVAVEPGVANSAVADRLEQRYPGTIAIDQPGEATRADTNSLLLRKSTLVIAILALVLGGLTVVNTMAMAVLERRSEFALLAAVGWSSALLGRLVLTEGLVLATGGVAAGLVLGAVAGGAVADLLGASAVVTPTTGLGVLALGSVIGLTMGAFGALYPAWRVTRLAPAEALG